jgi:outer membrane protein
VTGRVFPAVELAPASRQIDRAALLERASSGNAGIARSRRQVDAAQAAGAAARALWYPRVQLSGRLVEYASGAGHESAEWQGGAQLSYPLFTGGARGAAAQRAVAELGAARAELALAELRVADGIDRAIAVWNAANGRVEALEASVAQMEEVTRIERLALDAGAGVQTDYLVSEADLLRARASLTEARQAAVSARIQLALITGELSGPWLANNVETTQ